MGELRLNVIVEIFKDWTIQWTLTNPNRLGPEPIQISEKFGLVKATSAT